MEHMHNPHLFTPFMAWKGLFQHLERPPMDDYYEFKHAHKIQIEEWQLYRLPNYVSITGGIVAPSGTTTIPNTSLVSGSENGSVSGTTKSGNFNGSGTTRNGGTVKGGGTKASINTRGLLLTFNLCIHACIG